MAKDETRMTDHDLALRNDIEFTMECVEIRNKIYEMNHTCDEIETEFGFENGSELR